MLGQRLNARASRHQRLARRLRARHALFERRASAGQPRRGGRLSRVRFLRPLASAPLALNAAEVGSPQPDAPPVALAAALVDAAPSDERPADMEFEDAAPAALLDLAPSTIADADDTVPMPPVAAASVAAPSVAPAVAHLPVPLATEPRSPRAQTVPAAVADGVARQPARGADESPASSAAARPTAGTEPRPVAASAALDDALDWEARDQTDDAAPLTALQAAMEPRARATAPVEQRIARLPARRGERAPIDAEPAPPAAAAQPSVWPAAEAEQVAEETEVAAELPAAPSARLSEPALSAPPAQLDAETLFAPREIEARAPATWLERLTRVAEGERAPAPPAAPPPHWLERVPRAAEGERAPAASAAPPPAQPLTARASPPERPVSATRPAPAADVPDTVMLPPSTRRFLRPLVGVEPDDVPLRVGPAAALAVAAQAADALAFEGEVVLGAEAAQTLDTPRSLGLLAHELTHVARRSAPRFVPPVARDGVPGPPPTDEEELASRVEARVTRAAQQGVDGASLVAPNEYVAPRARAGRARALGDATRPPLRAELPGSPVPAAPPTQGMALDVPPSDAESFDFGGLPAPWEPFPNWITDTFAPAPPLNRPATAAPSLNGAAVAPPAGSAPVVQRAGEERSLETPAPTPASDAAPARAAAPQAAPPDLDELARQVYGILRRRLAAEARRAG